MSPGQLSLIATVHNRVNGDSSSSSSESSAPSSDVGTPADLLAFAAMPTR